jgi:hypothetical protein
MDLIEYRCNKYYLCEFKHYRCIHATQHPFDESCKIDYCNKAEDFVYCIPIKIEDFIKEEEMEI